MQGELMMAAPMAAQPHIKAGPRTATGPYLRSGFTLVELLVVILIVGLLASILTPVVMRSLATARNAGVKAEIDMLHMALMNYKSEYGSLPPCFDNQLDNASPAGMHLRRLFPRVQPPAQLAVQLQQGFTRPLTPGNAIYNWLSGFTLIPQSPLIGDRQKLYDFDNSRVMSTGVYHPSGKPESGFVYINSGMYANSVASPYSDGNNTYSALFVDRNGNGTPESGEFFNEDTCQILCAGRDGVWGTDDDLSNFWPATREEYLDSLQD